MRENRRAATVPAVAAKSNAPVGARELQLHFTPTSSPRQDPQAEQLRRPAEHARAQGDRPTYWHYRRAMLLRQAEPYTHLKEVA